MLAWAVLVVCFGYAPTYAQGICPLPIGYHDLPYWRADLVFTGVVERYVEDPQARQLVNTHSPRRLFNAVRFSVGKIYRGDAGASVELISSFQYKEGESYFIYAAVAKDRKIHQLDDGYCGRPPILLKDAGDDLEYAEDVASGSSGTRIFGTIIEDAWSLGTSPTRDPISNVEITIKGKAGSFTTRTDELGKYLFKNIPAGGYTITASGPSGLRERLFADPYDYYARRGTSPHTVLLGTAKKLNLLSLTQKPETYYRHSDSYNFVFSSLSLIEGKATGSDGKVPPQQYVWLIPIKDGKVDYSDYIRHSWTDPATGKFAFDQVPEGGYVVVVNRYNCHSNIRPEFARSFFPGVPDLKEAETIVINKNQDLRLKDFRLTPPLKERSFSGVVIGPDGSPIPRAAVYLTNPSVRSPNECFSVKIETTTDEQGRFRLKGYEGYPYELRAYLHQPKLKLTSRLLIAPAGNMDDIKLVVGEER